MLPWLEEHGRQSLVVLTKADKLSKSQRQPAAAALRRDLGLRRDPVLFSSTTGEGIDELWKIISAVDKG
jgi:GTP-binding protein